MGLSGATVAILGGGPSLRLVNPVLLWRLKVIAINEAMFLVPWADVVLFSDYPWFQRRRAEVLAFGGTVVTTSLEAVTECPGCKFFPVRKFGLSSGHTAVDYAMSEGARRIILLGFECAVVWGRSHWHDEYASPQSDYAYFLEDWRGYADRAVEMGVEIVNATPRSAITEFRKVPLLACIW